MVFRKLKILFIFFLITHTGALLANSLRVEESNPCFGGKNKTCDYCFSDHVGFHDFEALIAGFGLGASLSILVLGTYKLYNQQNSYGPQMIDFLRFMMGVGSVILLIAATIETYPVKDSGHITLPFSF